MSECIDCGAETKEGVGSARCPECWDARCSSAKKVKIHTPKKLSVRNSFSVFLADYKAQKE